MKRFKKKVRRFVRLYWFWVSLGLVLTKVSVEATYIERGYKAYGGEWLVLPVVMIVGYFVNEARMYLTDFIEEWREEKSYERRVAENCRRVQRERNSSQMKRLSKSCGCATERWISARSRTERHTCRCCSRTRLRTICSDAR